jgi:hypothetical protein
MDLGDRLQPHTAPDAGDCRVPYPVRGTDLLPPGLGPGVCGVPHRKHDLLFASFREGMGDVEGKGIVPAPVGPDLVTVHPNGGLPVYSLEIQQQMPVPPIFRHAEGPPVPQPVFLAHGSSDT